jgi:hypothetical protein
MYGAFLASMEFSLRSFKYFTLSKEDSIPGCTGYCEVVITTDPLIHDRGGNKVKVLTVSARKCSIKKI